jgi:hypothetical protein
MRVFYDRGANELTKRKHPLFRDSLTKRDKGTQGSGKAAAVVTTLSIFK